jgi:hypothetical protein
LGLQDLASGTASLRTPPVMSLTTDLDVDTQTSMMAKDEYKIRR